MWPPPRGDRDPFTGGWEGTLAERRTTDTFGQLESWAIPIYQGLVRDLVAARSTAKLSLRALAVRCGVSLSALTALEQGSAWPLLATMERVGRSLGLRLVTADCPDGHPDGLQALLVQVFDGLNMPWKWIAGDALVRPNTVYELRNQTDSPSMSTVLAIACAIGHSPVWRPVHTTAAAAVVGSESAYLAGMSR